MQEGRVDLEVAELVILGAVLTVGLNPARTTYLMLEETVLSTLSHLRCVLRHK